MKTSRERRSPRRSSHHQRDSSPVHRCTLLPSLHLPRHPQPALAPSSTPSLPSPHLRLPLPMPPAPARAKRLARELQECRKDVRPLPSFPSTCAAHPPPLLRAQDDIDVVQVGDSIDHFLGSFNGPAGVPSSLSSLPPRRALPLTPGPAPPARPLAGTAYEGGRFEVDITAPDRYPFEPLKIKFVTKVRSLSPPQSASSRLTSLSCARRSTTRVRRRPPLSARLRSRSQLKLTLSTPCAQISRPHRATSASTSSTSRGRRASPPLFPRSRCAHGPMQPLTAAPFSHTQRLHPPHVPRLAPGPPLVARADRPARRRGRASARSPSRSLCAARGSPLRAAVLTRVGRWHAGKALLDRPPQL